MDGTHMECFLLL